MSKEIDYLNHRLTQEERDWLDSRGRYADILVNDRMFAEGGEAEGSDEETWDDLVKTLTVPELRTELEERGLDATGNKPELQARLIEAGPEEDEA